MDHDEMLSQFSIVTGEKSERAKFFLESSNWQLEVALASFYENDGDVGNLDSEVYSVPDHSAEPTNPASAEMDTSINAPTAGKPKTRANTRFATLQTMQQNEESSDEEEGQAFYAGGSRSSGQQILGPPKKRDIVSDMFRSVQEHGGEAVDPHQHVPTGSSSFGGTGYRLGQTATDTSVIEAPKLPARPRTVVLKLWKDGFTLGDGPMRLYSDPANRDFLDFIKRGEIPAELTREAEGAGLHLDLEDHRQEEYTATRSKAGNAFSGKGHTLGSPAPNVVSNPPPSEAVRPSDINEDKDNEQAAVSAINVDPNAPSTTIQVRLSDGTRLSGRFNQSHTVGDLRRYITIARPQYTNMSFSLLTSYPSKELTNPEETLLQAGLLNAAIMQRMK